MLVLLFVWVLLFVGVCVGVLVWWRAGVVVVMVGVLTDVPPVSRSAPSVMVYVYVCVCVCVVRVLL